jgi:hypothetical protein
MPRFGKFALTPREQLPDLARQTASGENLFYKSHLPYPLATKTEPLLKRSEIEDIGQATADPSVETLKLWVPAERQRFQEICDICCNGGGQIHRYKDRFLEKHEDWVVYLVWVRIVMRLPPYAEMPPDATPSRPASGPTPGSSFRLTGTSS